MNKAFLISLVVSILYGCNLSSDRELTPCFIIIPHNLQHVRISYYYINNIAYGGDDPLQYVIEIENTSNHTLDNLRLGINYKYTASLKDLSYYQGFFKGYRPFGHSSFPAKSKLQFTFNKDSSNLQLFTDSSGKTMSNLVFFHSFHLKADQGEGTWGFPEP